MSFPAQKKKKSQQVQQAEGAGTNGVNGNPVTAAWKGETAPARNNSSAWEKAASRKPCQPQPSVHQGSSLERKASLSGLHPTGSTTCWVLLPHLCKSSQQFLFKANCHHSCQPFPAPFSLNFSNSDQHSDWPAKFPEAPSFTLSSVFLSHPVCTCT